MSTLVLLNITALSPTKYLGVMSPHRFLSKNSPQAPLWVVAGYLWQCLIVFRDLNKINGLSVFTLNLRPGVIIYQLVMSHLYTDYKECGWCWPGFTADIPDPWTDKYLGILDSAEARD